MIFRVTTGPDGAPSWWLYGAHVELLAWAGRRYVSLEFARTEASAFRLAALRVRYEIYPHPDGGWAWRAIEPVDNYMAYSGTSFVHQAEARRAARHVRRGVSHSTGL
ncbi:hypothetical protein QF031_002117 [Pseudarthrobacter defluvii]|nr:hypothetical protein [Pseudarthrobacter defluvii]